jgi:hypothetical protein
MTSQGKTADKGLLEPTEKERVAARQRQYRLDNGNACTFKYEKTMKGKLMRTYRNMESRVKGMQEAKAHLYEGLSLLEREVFYAWSLGDKDFISIFNGWVSSDYDNKLSPSIDRINTNLGYTLDNIRWLTHSHNSSLTSRNRKHNEK